MNNELADVFRKHEIVGINGGTATGSRWTCRCGEDGFTGGTRDHAHALGQRHLAEAVLAWIDERLDDAMTTDSDRGFCPVCGVRWCALFVSNAADLADWRARHEPLYRTADTAGGESDD